MFLGVSSYSVGPLTASAFSIVVLGGLLQDEFSGNQQKLPGLGDVPLLGNLFKAETRSRKKTNLMVFLRPTILRDAQLAGTANNADPIEFARMAISANQTLGIQPNRMGQVFGMGTYAGQQGGFEIRDMAKWLPQQMAAAKAAGF